MSQGYTEVRYDGERKRVVYEPLQLTQAFRYAKYTFVLLCSSPHPRAATSNLYHRGSRLVEELKLHDQLNSNRSLRHPPQRKPRNPKIDLSLCGRQISIIDLFFSKRSSYENRDQVQQHTRWFPNGDTYRFV